ncbi:MAG TPA: amylo-alpha-1,6-glucosidase [Candidatus Cloacimonadota bacterium]|nr:glycogen debranching enzyme N-terminal domain-containing protein [Candidatus Cloacimonadota bacterium]HOD53036.1 amylo-alpha-1,6-glucosidase [Candidatus Cloacimonadota bacterium]
MANYFLETQSHEWILSNQNGAYALGTGNLVPLRKYHSLLTKSNAQFERYNLLASLEEMIEWRGESFFLDSNHYNNCIYPEGFLHLVKSWLRPYPVFLFSALPHNDDILIRKSIMMDETSNTILIKYKNLSTNQLNFKIRPKFALRNHHHLNQAGDWDKNDIHTEICQDEHCHFLKVKRFSNQLECYGWLQHGQIYPEHNIYRSQYYPWEAMRGYPGSEDLISVAGIEFSLKTNETDYLIFSDMPIENTEELVARIEKRYKKYPLPYDIPQKRKNDIKSKSEENEEENSILNSLDYNDNIMFEYPDYLKILELSMTDFMANNDIVAGFPWFGAWGRDTMIALESIIQMPKGAEYAWSVLKKYNEQRKNGLLPNMCSESGQGGNYDTIDASLWFIIRLYETVEKLNQKGTQKQKTANWKEIIDITENTLNELLFKENEHFFIREDGLLELGHSFASATWMDAKISGNPVTPRDGAPVEINALLYNALCYYELMIEKYNNIAPESKFYLLNNEFIEQKNLIKESFSKYWIGDFLADRIYRDQVIAEYRPNAIIAASLPFTPLSIDKLQQIYECAHIELFTPYGLRTLSPRDYKFKKKYIGDLNQRDKAYHQGTVWAWLLLPFVKTWLRAYPGKSVNESRNHISYLIEKFRNGYQKGHIASIAEVWDGDKPHFPKGTPAQAWSVNALYCIEMILSNLEGDKS